jgi:hypothetical protein
MNCRLGKVRPNATAAVASGGARAAPSTSAAAHGMLRTWAIPATPNVVATTSSVLMMTIPRRSRLMERSEVVRLSQNNMTGRKSSSIASGGS